MLLAALGLGLYRDCVFFGPILGMTSGPVVFSDFDTLFESDRSLKPAEMPALPTKSPISEPFLDQLVKSSTGPSVGRARLECPDIYAFVCNKRGATHDPTGYVQPDQAGETQIEQLLNTLRKQLPTQSEAEIQEQMVAQIYNPKRRTRFEMAFHQVERAIERFINRQSDQVFTPLEKEQLKSRLRRVELQLPPPATLYSDEMDLLKRSDVIYERSAEGQLRLRVGGAYVLIAKSWFNLIFTLAHELAHSIDPCEIRNASLSFPAYDQLYACFVRTKMMDVDHTRSECFTHDYLSETFADWVATFVVAEALRTFSKNYRGDPLIRAVRNSVRDLCEQENDGMELDFTFHPSPKTRIERIFGRNPEILKLLNCNPPPNVGPYCRFEGPTPAKKVISKKTSLW